MALEDIERQLYRLKAETPRAKKPFDKARGKQTAKNPPAGGEKKATETVQESWVEIAAEEAQSQKEHFPRWLKIILIVIGAMTVATSGLVAFFIFGLGRTSADIELTVDGPREIERGVPFEVSVGFHNQGDVILRGASLTLELPQGVANVNNANEQAMIQDAVGDVGGGSFVKKTYGVLATGEKDSLQEIRAVLSYMLGNSRFEKDATFEMRIKEAAITLEIAKPDHILGGAAFELNITYKNISGFDFSSVALEAKYPPSFAFISSSIPPRSLNNRWEVGEVKSGESGGFIIEGSVSDANEETLNIPVTVYANFLGKDYLVTEALASVKVAPSPITLALRINNREQYAAKIGDTLNYTVAYQNNSGIALADVIIKANMAGELFDFASIDTDGAIDPLTQTLVWNASRVPTLKLLDAGASGEVNFKVRLKNQFPIRRLNDKNFYLRVAASIDSPTVPYYLAASKISAAAALETKVSGLVFFDTKVFLRDAASQVVNSGAFPPKVNQPTEYTVHWIIRNYATDIRDITVKSFLESGVSWTGAVKSNIDTVPVFNERTQEVTWNIDVIPATAGILSDPIEAVFQIKATPNITQINQFQPLLGQSKFEATDDFTNTEFKSSDGAITTTLPDDATIRQDEGKVIQ